MKLTLDHTAIEALTSQSQVSRRVTEAWAASNLYCIACTSPNLTAHRANFRVEDFHCPRCGRRVQLKSARHRIGRKVANSAYAPKILAIRENRVPDYAFLSFDPVAWLIRDLFVVPGHFITPSVIEKRPPLKGEARRAGWVGSNIRLDRVPLAGRIPVVLDGSVLPMAEVRAAFRQTAFLKATPVPERGWIVDVFACLDDLMLPADGEFGLSDAYAFEERLSRLHPRNRNIRPKIRQQLQVLRDHGLLEFVGSGRYRMLHGRIHGWRRRDPSNTQRLTAGPKVAVDIDRRGQDR